MSKRYTVFPPMYRRDNPSAQDNFTVVCYSRRTALRAAVKLGPCAEIDVTLRGGPRHGHLVGRIEYDPDPIPDAYFVARLNGARQIDTEYYGSTVVNWVCDPRNGTLVDSCEGGDDDSYAGSARTSGTNTYEVPRVGRVDVFYFPDWDNYRHDHNVIVRDRLVAQEIH